MEPFTWGLRPGRESPRALVLAPFLVLVASSACASTREPEDSPPSPPQVGAARLDASVQRAGRWLAGAPDAMLRFDSAIGLHAILERVSTPELRAAHARAMRVARADADHPMHRFWRPDFEVPAEVTSGWTAPRSGERRINVNRVVIEALYADRHGWRPETMAYVLGGMRDEGGYHTTHGLWALTIARANGGLEREAFEAAARTLGAELKRAQRAAPPPVTCGEVDLVAERVLVLALSGDRSDEVQAWGARLVALQRPDGSFGVPSPEEHPALPYHATLIAAWALAVLRGP